MSRPDVITAPPTSDSAAAAAGGDQRLRQAQAQLQHAQDAARPWEMSQALAELARGYAAVGAAAAGEAFLERALDWARLSGSTDCVVDLLCELCETLESIAAQQESEQRGSSAAARERLHDHAAEAARQAGHVSDPAWEVKVLLRVSDVLDSLGDHAEALALQARALELMSRDWEQQRAHDGLPPLTDYSALPDF